MANKNLFRNILGRILPRTDAVNKEGAPAYLFSPKQALAQYAVTGCLNRTFYASADTQLKKVLELCEGADPLFIAKTAVYCRKKGSMKDMPALLCAILSVKGPGYLNKVFSDVIDNGKMLRNFVQIMRSGVTGRKSLGTMPKRLVKNWFENRDENEIFRASIGNDPSFADIIKMAHPKPKTKVREAFLGYLAGREYDENRLPAIVREFERYKREKAGEVPDVPFQMLTSLDLGSEEWSRIAMNAGWQMIRMNLNTFARHGVFKTSKDMAGIIAGRLSNREEIAKARVFPYQLLVAYKMTGAEVPEIVRNALQDAMEIATYNIPQVDGKVFVCPDVSGSMTSPVTGFRQGSTTAVRCVDIAALTASAMLRKNPLTEVLPFANSVVSVRLNPRDSVMTNAGKLAKFVGGGTNCSAPLKRLNDKRAMGDLVMLVSDNQSWVDAGAGKGTALMKEWNSFKARNTNAKLVCIDIQPYCTTQAAEREDILNVGGFSDSVFEIVEKFLSGELHPQHWVKEIESVEI